MSHLNRLVNNPYHPAAASFNNLQQPAGAQSNLVDLNEVFNEAMQCFEAERSKKTVSIRFDPLPYVLADQQQMLELFTSLLRMIVLHSPIGNNLFLYVKSNSTDTGYIDLSAPVDSPNVNIHFFTNIVIDQFWLNLYHQKLEEISIIITTFKGRFSCNKLTSAGCLFSITLPGKLSL